jgi:hypothetical protein
VRKYFHDQRDLTKENPPPLASFFSFLFSFFFRFRLVLEPFICPAMFETYGGSIPGDPDGKGQTVGAIDEWTLSTMMRTNLGDAGFEAAMREHYETFITYVVSKGFMSWRWWRY